MQSAQPPLSIVIPAFNAAEHIGQTLDSILIQGRTGYEVIVVDDGSTDDIAAVLESHDLPIVYRRQTNQGPSTARNAGAEVAKGAYLVFLDSDDRLERGWLELFSRSVATGAASVHCSVRIIDSQTGGTSIVGASSPRPAFDWTTGARLPGAYAIGREWFAAVGGFCSDLRYGEHTELWLRLAAAMNAGGGHELVLPDILVTKHHDRSPAKVSSYDRVRMEGAEYVLRTHGRTLEEDRAFRSDYHAVAGVAAIRLGELQRGRGHLREAARLSPRLRRKFQFLLARVPFIGPAFWRRGNPR